MQSPTKVPKRKPYKQRKCLAARKSEVIRMKSKFPTKVPVIVERYKKEKYLPLLDKTKFLVPRDLPMFEFLNVLRDRMNLSASHAFYILVNERNLCSMSFTMTELHRDLKDEDGFLYMTYASQEMFG
ncbi:microtubule-associated proteins 1A/1B light chain 3C [Ranitomeya imitator]|uniref:microtubule-associated proteins 1A/1B light chain 3C n=1 Tax=Ranitomeya imitator TaxID=111125 RepID=UPI0037E84BE2